MPTFKTPWTQTNTSNKLASRTQSATQARTTAQMQPRRSPTKVQKPHPTRFSKWCSDVISSRITMHTITSNKNNSMARLQMISRDLRREACKWRAGRSAAAMPANNSSNNRWWLSRRNWIRQCQSQMQSRAIMEGLDPLRCWLPTKRSRTATT